MIPITFKAGGTGATAFSLNRHGAEFSDEDLSTARTLQPVLKAVEGTFMSQHYSGKGAVNDLLGSCDRGPEPTRITTPQIAPLGQPRTPLTSRELEVLSLVAKGFTAISIGHHLQISARTVRKHLEHVYEKTGQRDRLLAVTYARRVGLLEAEEVNGQPQPPTASRAVTEDA